MKVRRSDVETPEMTCEAFGDHILIRPKTPAAGAVGGAKLAAVGEIVSCGEGFVTADKDGEPLDYGAQLVGKMAFYRPEDAVTIVYGDRTLVAVAAEDLLATADSQT